MAKDILTDAQVELEIDRLMNSKAVKLAKKEAQIKYKRRQYMYQLRTFEKRGKELTKQGYTLDNNEERMLGDIKEEQ
jgi:hypothetical protein